MGNRHIKVYPVNIEKKYNNRKVRPVLDSDQIIHSNQNKYINSSKNWIDIHANDFIPMFIYDKSEISLYRSNKN